MVSHLNAYFPWIINLPHTFLIACIQTALRETGIVDLHENGRIWAESKGEGKGCTFFVQLPLHSRNHVRSEKDKRGSVLDFTRSSVRNLLSSERDEKQSEAIVPSRRSPIAAEGQAPVPLVVEATWKPTILVVDDSAMNRKVDKFTLPPFLPPSVQSLSQSVSHPVPTNVSFRPRYLKFYINLLHLHTTLLLLR